MINFFLLLQAKMERIISFLVSKKYISDGEQYAEFVSRANVHLMRNDAEEYFEKWLEFIKQLFLEVYDRKDEELRVKASEMN